MQMDDTDLSRNQKRLKPCTEWRDQYWKPLKLIPISTLKIKSNLAKDEWGRYIQVCILIWNGRSFRQKDQFADLLWTDMGLFGGCESHGGGFRKAVSFKMNRFRAMQGDVKTLISTEIGNKTEPQKRWTTPLKTQKLEFVRFWAVQFPRSICMLNRIQKEIYSGVNLPAGDYSFFSTQIECLFTEPYSLP